MKACIASPEDVEALEMLREELPPEQVKSFNLKTLRGRQALGRMLATYDVVHGNLASLYLSLADLDDYANKIRKKLAEPNIDKEFELKVIAEGSRVARDKMRMLKTINETARLIMGREAADKSATKAVPSPALQNAVVVNVNGMAQRVDIQHKDLPRAEPVPIENKTNGG